MHSLHKVEPSYIKHLAQFSGQLFTSKSHAKSCKRYPDLHLVQALF